MPSTDRGRSTEETQPMENCTLPVTGPGTLIAVAVAAAIIAIGVLLVVSARRRRSVLMALVPLLALGFLCATASPATAGNGECVTASGTPGTPVTTPSSTPPDPTTSVPGTTTSTTAPPTTTTSTTAPPTTTTSTTSTTTTSTVPCVQSAAVDDEIFLDLASGSVATGNLFTNDTINTPLPDVLVNGISIGAMNGGGVRTIAIGSMGALTVHSNGDYQFGSNGVTGTDSSAGYAFSAPGCILSSAQITIVVIEIT